MTKFGHDLIAVATSQIYEEMMDETQLASEESVNELIRVLTDDLDNGTRYGLQVVKDCFSDFEDKNKDINVDHLRDSLLTALTEYWAASTLDFANQVRSSLLK